MGRHTNNISIIKRGIIPIKIVIFILVFVAGAATGVYIYVSYVNTVGLVTSGSDVAQAFAVTFSGSFNAGTTSVGLNNGFTTNVNWDGKAVGVVALVGSYIKVREAKYYTSVASAYGVKAENSCPWWSAWLTGATLYDVKIKMVNGVPQYKCILIESKPSPEPLRLEYNANLASILSALGVTFTPISSGNSQVILIPVYGKTYYCYGIFDFFSGSSGAFGGCPQLGYSHTSIARGNVTIASIMP